MNAAAAVHNSSSLDWSAGRSVPLSKRGPAIRVAGEAPSWLPAFVTRISDLSTLPVVGPCESQPLNIEDVLDALEFMSRVLRNDTVTPWVGRLNTGGIEATWRCGDVAVEAVFDRARNEQEVFVTVGESEWEASGAEADSLMTSVIDRLSRSHLEHVTSA